MRANVDDLSIYYELAGQSAAPLVTFSHSLGAALGMWESQISALSARFRTLAYDIRGHGQSSVTEPPYSLEQLADDAVRLLDALHVEQTAFVGLSLGGMIGQMLALRHPERLSALVLCDTTSDLPETLRPLWDERIATTRERGMAPHVEPTIERWFTAEFRARHPEVVDRIRHMVSSTDPRGYIGCSYAIRELSLTERLSAIRLPTLVVVGADDPGTPPALARIIVERIAGAELVVLDDAAHLSNVQQSQAFNTALLRFLDACSLGDRARA